MKKLLLTMAATFLTVAVFAQGTVIFSNSALQRNSSGVQGTASSTWTALPLTQGLINFGLFYGVGQSTSLQLLTQLGVNSTSAAGVIANPTDNISSLNLVGLPGAPAGALNVFVQVKGWSAVYGTDWVAAQAAALDNTGTHYFGQTAIVNAEALGQPTGPATPLWQSATGTLPSRFKGGFTLFTTIPEPSSMALAGIGAAALLIFRRRK